MWVVFGINPCKKNNMYLASAVPGRVGTSPSGRSSAQDEEAGRGFRSASGLSACCWWTLSSGRLTAPRYRLLYRPEQGEGMRLHRRSYRMSTGPPNFKTTSFSGASTSIHFHKIQPLSLILLCVQVGQKMNRYSSFFTYQRKWPEASNSSLFCGVACNIYKSQSWSEVSDCSCKGSWKYLLLFEDVAELRTRTQTVQKALVNLKCEVFQFDAVTLSDIQPRFKNQQTIPPQSFIFHFPQNLKIFLRPQEYSTWDRAENFCFFSGCLSSKTWWPRYLSSFQPSVHCESLWTKSLR